MNKLKFFIQNIIIVLIISVLTTSCKKDDPPAPTVVHELDGFQLVSSISNEHHQIELYTTNGKLQTGYNAIYFQVKNSGGNTASVDSATWMPMMYMMSKSHSAPHSTVTPKTTAKLTYGGYIVFQMAGDSTEYWELTVNYSISGVNYTAKGRINVVAAPKRVVEVFQGLDSAKYILALVEPAAPRVAVNDMKAVLYQMQSIMSFVRFNGYKIKIDPRMPSMGNHGSPNNVDLTQISDGMYGGKLSLTMTGYWKINLQLENAAGSILKGEPVTDTTTGSSIYFDLEF